MVASQVGRSEGHKAVLSDEPQTSIDPLDIMVVDDDVELRESLIDLLEMEGFRARGAGDGWEALSQLREGYLPDVILLDLFMPVMNGWELRDQLLKNTAWADIPVIVITAGDERNNPALDRVQSVLSKPFGFARLLELVSHAKSLA